MTVIVPRDLDEPIRDRLAACPRSYHAYGPTEHVFADMPVVWLTQTTALQSWHDVAVLPTVDALVATIMDVRQQRFDMMAGIGRAEWADFPGHAETRAYKLVYDALAELDAASLTARYTTAPVVLHDVNDVVHGIDATLQVPAHWQSSIATVTLGFQRRWSDSCDWRRMSDSHARFTIHCELHRCDWVGEVALFPATVVAHHAHLLRDRVAPQPTLFDA